METFDNTRPLVAAMAIGCAKASLERIKEIVSDCLDPQYITPYLQTTHIASQIYRMEAEWEAARLLTLKAAWMTDNKKPKLVEFVMKLPLSASNFRQRSATTKMSFWKNGQEILKF